MYGTLIQNCICRDIIFNKLWEYVYIDSNLRRIFLEAMEPFILNDQLTSIPPAILQHFVNTYENTGKLQVIFVDNFYPNQINFKHLPTVMIFSNQIINVSGPGGMYHSFRHRFIGFTSSCSSVLGAWSLWCHNFCTQ